MKRYSLFLGAFLFFVFSFSFKTPETEWSQDLGRHIKMGQIIWQTKKIPSTNLFSYTYPDFPFINHHWLSEVIFYFVFSFLGNFGLVFLKTILVMVSFILVILAAGQEKSWGALLPFWTLAALIFRERVDVRPEIFGFFFFAFFLFILQKERGGQTGWFLILPFIEALWVNIHLSFVFGLFLTTLWLIEKIASKQLSKKAVAFVLAIFLASFFNPHFIRGAVYPFLIFKNYGYSIVENQNIFFLEKMMRNPNIFFFKIGVLLGMASFPLTPQRVVFSLLGFTVLSAVATWQIRHFPFFALFLIFVLSQNLPFVFEKKFIKKIKPLLGYGGCFLILVLSFLYITNFYYKTHDRIFNFGFKPAKIPAEKGADFLLKIAPEGRIFNNFDIGSFLDYTVYPQIKVFADSRPEGYPEEFWQEYKKAQENQKVWEELVKKYNIGAVFFAHTDQTPWGSIFLKRIVRNQNWQMVYLDEMVVVLLKENLLNLPIITKENVLDQAENFTDHTQFIYLANFCRRIGWFSQERILLEKALKVEPFSYWTNARLAQIYLSSDNSALQYKAQPLLQKLKNPIFWF